MESERPFLWADIFYAILSEPQKSLLMLADSSQYEPDKSAIFAAGLMVVLASTIGNLASKALEGATPALSEIVGSAFLSIVFWYALALLLKFFSSWRSNRISLGNCLIVTGWAFLPLIFKAPIMCFSLAAPLCNIFMIALDFWFCFLEIEAFDAVLKLGKLKMITLLVVLPPLFLCTYLFWVIVTGSVLIGALISVISPS